MPEYPFSEPALLEIARRATGLSDFGDSSFREGLHVLLETYDTTAGLSESGRKMNWQRLVQRLSTRLRVERAFARHPEIRDREIRRPMYLTGLPRTGTSALFNLLAVDPAARPLLLWEGLFPDPVEGLEPGQPDPRHEAVKASYERMRKKEQDFTKIHFVDADIPEECVLLLAHAFCDAQLGIEVLMEPYQSWFQKQDLHDPYAYYRDLLKMVDWRRPGERWLLKSPVHLWALDVLVEMFPDACIIVTHRNPIEAIASYCSMMHTLMMLRGCSEQPDLGPTVLEYLARSLERGLEARDRSDGKRFIDVDYLRFVENPMRVVRGIYDHFELELTPQAEAAMQEHLRKNPRGKHGAHRYDLEQYGLTPEAVRRRLASYIDRFSLPSNA
jgi:hypothetical protein